MFASTALTVVGAGVGCSAFGSEQSSSSDGDASPPLVSDTPSADSGQIDTSPAPSPTCPRPPSAVDEEGTFIGVRAAVTVDGQIDSNEWGCVPFHRLDLANAARRQYGETGATLDLAVAWQDDAIFVAARVRNDPTERSGSSANAHRNDCVHLYFDVDGIVRGAYDENDSFMLAVDHAGRVTDYVKVGGEEKLMDAKGVTAITSPQPGGFDAEIRIERVAYLKRMSPFAPEDTMGFDFATTDGHGDPPQGYKQFLVWSWKEDVPCQGSCSCAEDAPNCNTRHFGKLRLVAPE